MKTIQLEINFPIFEGFYCSQLDLSENIEVGEGEEYSMTEEQFDNIDWNSTNENVQVTVYNLVGQPVFTKDIAAGLQTVKHGLSKGTYVIKAKTAVSGEKTILKSIINN